MNPISTASAGLLSGFARFEKASATLVAATSGQSEADPAASTADQIAAGEQVYASTATLAVASRMFKHLLDIKV